jgi:branched-chain amino acid transport system permease protein
MIYHRQLDSALGSELPFMGVVLDASSVGSWLGAILVFLIGLGLFELCRRQFAGQWGRIQESIEKEQQRQEAA